MALPARRALQTCLCPSDWLVLATPAVLTPQVVQVFSSRARFTLVSVDRIGVAFMSRWTVNAAGKVGIVLDLAVWTGFAAHIGVARSWRDLASGALSALKCTITRRVAPRVTLCAERQSHRRSIPADRAFLARGLSMLVLVAPNIAVVALYFAPSRG